MSLSSAVAGASSHRPVFVLGERAPAVEMVRALGRTPALYALPMNRLLPDLISAVTRGRPALEPVLGPEAVGGAVLAGWYREVQAAGLRRSGKTRTVEFSGLSILQLCDLFPTGQFVVVRQVKRAIPRSRRLPPLERRRIFEVDSAIAATPESLARVLAFLAEPADAVELDLSDGRVGADRVTPG